jgi:hypothetical protein
MAMAGLAASSTFGTIHGFLDKVPSERDLGRRRILYEERRRVQDNATLSRSAGGTMPNICCILEYCMQKYGIF